jgi:hypothetical protein
VNRMDTLQERFAVQSSEAPFRDLADAISTLAEILLTYRDDESVSSNYIKTR